LSATEAPAPEKSSPRPPGDLLRWADKRSYGESFQKDLVDQYRLLVEMADNLSARRTNANEFFLLACTALLSVAGAVTGLANGSSNSAYPAVVVILSSVGGVFAVVWMFTLQTYARLNSVKYSLVVEMERRLPVNPYEAEWEVLGATDRVHRAGVWTRHRRLTSLERLVPLVFGALFVLLAIWSARAV
jgi:hypothetical protein